MLPELMGETQAEEDGSLRGDGEKASLNLLKNDILTRTTTALLEKDRGSERVKSKSEVPTLNSSRKNIR